MARFENVSCSQCGQDFGPGDNGFSHCDQHRKPQGSNVHLAFHADELAYLRARAAAEERSVPWVVRRLVREAMDAPGLQRAFVEQELAKMDVRFTTTGAKS